VSFLRHLAAVMLVVTIVGGFLIDITNAIVITVHLNLLK